MTDVIVVGGGHNGLACAAYLLRGRFPDPAPALLPGLLAAGFIVLRVVA